MIKKILIKLYFDITNLLIIFFRRNIKIDKDVQIRKTKIRNNGYISIGRGSRIGTYCILNPEKASIIIGKYTSINSFSIITGGGNVTIGDYVAIAPRCSLIASNHIYSDPDTPIKKQGLIKKGIIIEDDVWLGTGVTVLDGVTIGQGSIIGAGSVVTKSIPPYSIAVGVPAKIKKSRKSEI